MPDVYDQDDNAAAKPVQPNSAERTPTDHFLCETKEDTLLGLLQNSKLDEAQLCLLLGRKELSTNFLEQLTKDDLWRRSYRVRRGVAFHPHAPQTLGLSLVRELYTADIVQLSILVSGAPALRNLAEELVLMRLPQLPTALKMILARQGSPRVAGALLVDGSPETLSIVLDGSRLNEGQILRALARISIPDRVVKAIAEHSRWSKIYSIRLALLKNSKTPLSRVLVFLPGISTNDLRLLVDSSLIPPTFLPHARRALANRTSGPAWH